MDIAKSERKKAIDLLGRINGGMEILTVCNPCDGIYLNAGSPCSLGKNIISIAPNGDVYPCQFLKIPLGNIKEKPISYILKNDFITLINDRKNLKGRCGMCEYKENCGGCRARAYAKWSDYFEEDPASEIPHVIF